MLSSSAHQIRAEIPYKFQFLFEPWRYKVPFGGRGSAKSWSIGRALVLKLYQEPLRWLCAREFQKSVKESVHHLLASQIQAVGLSDYFDVQDKVIKGRYLLRHHDGQNKKSEFIFEGLHANTSGIRSMEDLDGAWVEEAHNVTANSWKDLIPTVRKENSEIWVSFNPRHKTDPTFKMFVPEDTRPPRSRVEFVSWRDNPFITRELLAEKDHMARVDPDAYLHIWEGQCRKSSKAQIFAGKWVIEYFEPGADWHGPYQGCDWGFAQDPTVLIRFWIHGAKLYIEYEAYGIGVDTVDLPKRFEDAIPRVKDYVTRADSARPETVNHMRRHGFPKFQPCTKWDGSVEDGIAWIRSFEQIVIHPRCTHVIDEASLYCYKVDKLTEDVLPDIVDKHNHCWDAIRYGADVLIKRTGKGLFDYLQQIAGQTDESSETLSREEKARQELVAKPPQEHASATTHQHSSAFWLPNKGSKPK